MPDDRTPSTPRFEAAQPPLEATTAPPLSGGHPLHALIESTVYPATREDLILAGADDDAVTVEQLEWLASTLPGGRYGSADQVTRALGASGLEAPSSAARL